MRSRLKHLLLLLSFASTLLFGEGGEGVGDSKPHTWFYLTPLVAISKNSVLDKGNSTRAELVSDYGWGLLFGFDRREALFKYFFQFDGRRVSLIPTPLLAITNNQPFLFGAELGLGLHPFETRRFWINLVVSVRQDVFFSSSTVESVDLTVVTLPSFYLRADIDIIQRQAGTLALALYGGYAAGWFSGSTQVTQGLVGIANLNSNIRLRPKFHLSLGTGGRYTQYEAALIQKTTVEALFRLGFRFIF